MDCFGAAAPRNDLLIGAHLEFMQRGIPMSLLGIDVGISGCKAVAFDLEGHALGQAQPRVPPLPAEPGGHGARPRRGVGSSEHRRARRRQPPRAPEITAVAIATHGESVVPVDAAAADLPVHHRHRHARGQADAVVGGEGGRQAPLRHHRHAAAPDVHGQQADVAPRLQPGGVQRSGPLPLHGRLPLHPDGSSAHHGSQPRLPHHAPGHPHAHVGRRAAALWPG